MDQVVYKVNKLFTNILKSNKSFVVFKYVLCDYIIISFDLDILSLVQKWSCFIGFNWKEINRGSPGSPGEFCWKVQKCLKFVPDSTAQFAEDFQKTQAGDPQFFSLWMNHIWPEFIMTGKDWI